MLRLEAAGYQIVLHCHDEIVAEVPEGFGSVEQFRQLLITPPAWADELPLNAKGWTNNRYCKAAPVAAPDAAPNESVAEKHATFSHETVEKRPGSAKVSTVPPLADLLAGARTVCCPNPDHNDHTPSLHIYDDGFYCFGCGFRGDLVDWLMYTEELSRVEAEKVLADLVIPEAPTPEELDEKKRRTLQYAEELWGISCADRGHPCRALPRASARDQYVDITGHDFRRAALSTFLLLRQGRARALLAGPL